MGRGKHFKTDKEKGRERELSYKNKELQREVARMRRRIDQLESQNPWRESPQDEAVEVFQAKKQKDRTCYQCREGGLVYKEYGKFDGPWYYRECSACSYRTRSKKVTPDVEK